MDQFGRSPIHEACLARDLTSIELLLNAGAEIDSKDVNGDTALHRASEPEDFLTVRYLLKRGANPSILNDCDVSADERLFEAFGMSAVEIISMDEP
jgi:ankyrin repeat protein